GRGGRGQRREQVAVELDRGQSAVAVEQGQRQRTLAGPDLDDVVAGTGIDRQHDALDHAAVVQEVLAEVLLGVAAEAIGVARVAGARGRALPAHAPARRSASRLQASLAANRLDGSAVPVPAMSSAVPWSTATRG